MNYLVRAVASPGMAAGFRLAGLFVDEVDASEDSPGVGRLLLRAAARSSTGIILVEQEIFDRLPEAVRKDFEQRILPMLVPVPAAEFAVGDLSAQDYVLNLLRRAIGYRVHLQ